MESQGTKWQLLVDNFRLFKTSQKKQTISICTL